MKTLPPPKEEWQPRYWTKPESFISLGDEVIAFAETFLVVTRGDSRTNGKPLRLLPYQKWLLRALLEINPATGFLRYKQALLLLPRKNGKSIIASIILLYLLLFSRGGEQFFCAATNLRQAHIVFDECALQVMKNPWLRQRITIRRDYLENNLTKVKLRPVPAEGGALQGFAPTAAVGDELADWPDTEVYDALTQGTGEQDWSLFLGISTAGSHKETLLGELYDYGVKVADGELYDPTFGFFAWQADEDDDPLDEKTWIKANPSLQAGVLKMEGFRAAIRMADATSMNAFLKFKLNRWVRFEGVSFVSPFHWNNALKVGQKIPKGARITIGFDGSRTDDSTGFVICDVDTGLMELAYYWEKGDRGDSWKVPRDEVEAALHNLFNDYDVRMLYGDPAYYGTDLDNWSKAYPKRIMQVAGNPFRMVPMSRDFLLDLYKGELSHAGDERFTEHVFNAVMRENGVPAKEKRGSPRKIDFLMCAILSAGARRHVKSVRKGMPHIPR